MGFLNSIFGGGSKSNPANAAMPYLNQIPGMATQNLQPWQTAGMEAQNVNQGQYNRMAANPADFFNELRSSYTPSKGYQFRQEQMNKALRGSAAAGGRVGTESNQAAQAKLVQDLLSEDEGAYIDRLLGIQSTGLQGNENIAGRGFGAASDLTNVLGSTLGAQGALAYKGQENMNQAKSDRNKMLMQLFGAGLGAFGGPAGMAVGSSLGGSLAGGGSQPTNTQQFGMNLFNMGGR